MKLPRRRFLHLAAGAAVLPSASRIARAQAYPARPVRIVVGVAPGAAFTIDEDVAKFSAETEKRCGDVNALHFAFDQQTLPR